METGSKKMRCSYCGMQMMIPHHTYAIQCLQCQNMIHVQPSDRVVHALSSTSHATGRLHDLFNTASGNTNINRHRLGSSGYHPQQAWPLPQLHPVSAHGRKRAVLCGVSYYGQRYNLNGTVNDVKCMKYFLTHISGFPSDSILVLTEEESHPSLIPTKNNIRKALKWLVQGCQPGDSLVFHFSGHGSQQLDYNGDEVDGYDETLWPVDHQKEGKILDDEINATIVRPLPRGAKLHAIIDACHSGTILDLPLLCRMDRSGYYMWEDHGRQSAIYKGTSGGLAISISACDDHQVSVDTTEFDNCAGLSGNTATGALTYSFIKAAQNEPGLTYGRLLKAMRQTIRDTKTRILGSGSITSLLKNVLHRMLPQEPQLSSSEKFEIYQHPFSVS